MAEHFIFSTNQEGRTNYRGRNAHVINVFPPVGFCKTGNGIPEILKKGKTKYGITEIGNYENTDLFGFELSVFACDIHFLRVKYWKIIHNFIGLAS